MRLAATLETIDGDTGERSPRRLVALRGTLRDPGEAPHEIAIVDVSDSGFLAELPEGAGLPIEARVRVAATLLGTHEAVVVRRDGALHGFAFARPLDGGIADTLQGEQPSTVTPFPGVVLPAPSTSAATRPALSPRASLGLMLAISAGLWGALAIAVFATAALV